MNKTYTIYDTRLKITGLLEGSEYLFRVTAVNAAGDSQPSDASPYILCKDPTCKIFYLQTLTGAKVYRSSFVILCGDLFPLNGMTSIYNYS